MPRQSQRVQPWVKPLPTRPRSDKPSGRGKGQRNTPEEECGSCLMPARQWARGHPLFQAAGRESAFGSAETELHTADQSSGGRQDWEAPAAWASSGCELLQLGKGQSSSSGCRTRCRAGGQL